MNKQGKRFKKLKKQLRSIAFDVQYIFNLDRNAAVEWLNTPNIQFKGKKPVELVIQDKADIVINYIDHFKIKKEFKC